MQENITQEEKIDYIYTTLKKQESRVFRGTIFKWWFRIFMLLYIVYFIKVWLPAMIDSLMPTMPEFPDATNINTDVLRDAYNNFIN